jgi:hypothetical protein
VRLLLPSAELDTYTDDVSRSGFSVRLHAPPAMETEVSCVIHLPDGVAVRGRAVCRNVRPGGITGFSLDIDVTDAVLWSLFIEQEEQTGGLWRMLSRYVAASDEPGSSLNSVIAKGPFGELVQPTHRGAGELDRSVPFSSHRNVVLQLHSVGETGEAYRIAFSKHPSDPGSLSPLREKLPGFAELAEASIARVLRDNVLLRLTDDTPLFPARVCALRRGGFAYLQRGDDDALGLVSLCVGELILVAVDGSPFFPFFESSELVSISEDLAAPAPIATPTSMPAVTVALAPQIEEPPAPLSRAAAAEVANPELGSRAPTSTGLDIQPVPTTGLEALRFAQAQAERSQTRRYGDRALRLFPDVWARATDDRGHEVMGPTMEDGERTCVLALYGHGAPRVVPLSDDSGAELVEVLESDRQLPV